MTGTGSGKTEAFLLPILGKLATEAQAHPATFRDQPAMRALILYPMNALVNDQLGRLRALFGDARTVQKFKQWAGRPPNSPAIRAAPHMRESGPANATQESCNLSTNSMSTFSGRQMIPRRMTIDARSN